MAFDLVKIGDAAASRAQRWVPDPLVLAFLLTLVVLAGALANGEPQEIASAWFDSFASGPLLAFALQMCLVLVTGHAFASSPPIRRIIDRLAGARLSPPAASALVALVACISAVIHWGLGAVAGALLAKEIGVAAKRSGRRVHYPILGAAAYSGLAVWHGGLSGSAPLKVAVESDAMTSFGGAIPVSATLWSPLNFWVTGGLCLLLPGLFYVLTPKAGGPEAALPQENKIEETVRSPDGLAEKLSESRALAYVSAGLGLLSVAWLFSNDTLKLDLNFVNAAFLFLGLLFHGSLRRYADAAVEASKGCVSIILQFPIYFGILGLLKASGMIAGASLAMTEWASGGSLCAWLFGSAGLVNFFVPSGGGQWAIQGEIVLRSAQELGVPLGEAVLAFSYGDAWTNLLQPFWALPLLGVMGLKAKDILGYTAIAALVVGAYVLAVLAIY